MGPSPPPSAHRALLDLERSSAPPAALLDEAARILGIGFDTIKNGLFEAPGVKSSRTSVKFAPKEEWALRWLLKKTGNDGKSTSPNSEGESSANNDPRKWLLFYHLVCTTPVKKLAKMLREQDAMRQIQDALNQILKVHKTSISIDALSTSDGSTSRHSDDEYELPHGLNKKRKRSPTPGAYTETYTSTFQIVFSILRALEVCFDVVSIADDEDYIAQQHMRIALSLTPNLTATLLGLVIGNINIILADPTKTAFHDNILHSMTNILALWDLRHGPDLGHSSDESDQAFTSHCLLPGLSLLNAIKDSGLAERRKASQARLEKLIAIHAVEPARRIFFDELVTTWQAAQDPLLPEHVKPTVDQLQRLLLSRDRVDSQLDDTADTRSTLIRVAPIILEIAIRSCPRSTVKKSQHEQPWLEALFVCLAHMMGCSLIAPGQTLPENPGKPDLPRSIESTIPTPASLSCLEKMLSTVIQWKLSLSLPLLSSLTQHFASLQQLESTDWGLVTKIIQLDVNVFLPNSGLSTAYALFSQLQESLHDKIDDVVAPGRNMPLNYQSRVHVLKLLMKGLASARDLRTFVNIWVDRLAALQDDRASKFRLGEFMPSYSLWEDEDVIAEFSGVAKTSATPDFIESHLFATAQALSDDTFNGRHYGLVVVLDTLVTAHWKDVGSEKAMVETISDNIQNAIHSDKAFARLKGWLWRLLRRILSLAERAFPSVLLEGLLGGKERSIIEKAMKTAKGDIMPSFTPTLCFSEVERFHCFISTIALDGCTAKDCLNIEMKALTHHLSKLMTGDEMKEFVTMQLWDGRITSLMGKSEVVMAFLGILLQNPQVLYLSLDATIDLLKTMAPVLELEGLSEPRSGLAFIFEALLLDEAIINSPGFVKKCVKAIGLLDQDRMNDRKLAILQALPKEAMSKSQRQQIAEWQRQKVTTVRGTQTDGVDSDGASKDLLKVQPNSSANDDSAMTLGGLQRSCRTAREAVGTQTEQDVIRLCEEINHGDSLSSAQFPLLASMLYKGDTIFPHITRIASDLSALLPKSKDLDSFCLIADCIKIILDKHHESVNQWTIDNLLACTAITLSHQGPHIPNAAPIIFERLCRSVGTILSRYRIRVGGRYHLLLPVLNSLLRCLFAPESHSITTQSQLEFQSKLPPWILSTPTKLSKDSSTHLTRLLTSICNPTPSSVKKSHNFLTDDTKKARRIAGEFMQYFIAEYAHCQLNGRIDLDAKEGLMPGLYAVLDGMGKEIMRAMNARMDASQRAIWKGLYEDWSRFGRWNGM